MVSEVGQCNYCLSRGNVHEMRVCCPAKDSKCNYGRKKGHFAAMCRRKASAHMVEEMCGADESDDDGGAHLINTVTDAGKRDWCECIEVDGFHIDIQIDTGATKSLLPYKVFKDMLYDTPITKTTRRFKSYTHHPITVEGYVTLPTRYKNKVVDVQYYVVHVDQQPLLLANQRTARPDLKNTRSHQRA